MILLKYAGNAVQKSAAEEGRTEPKNAKKRTVPNTVLMAEAPGFEPG